jgi:tetratricopeptide (TPR) repeat protein
VHLQALVRKELVRPDRAAFPGEDAFRFRHLLIRDAAYEAMPKELRAALHERFAGWLEGTVGERVVEFEEVLGYHFEQAHRYRLELGPADEHAKELGAKGAQRLGSAGERALARGDVPAAVSLLDRAVELLPADDATRAELLCDLGHALTDLGEFDRAETVLAEAKAAAGELNLPALGAIAALRSAWVQSLVASRPIAAAHVEFEEFLRELEGLGHERGIAEASFLLGIHLMWKGHHEEAMLAVDRAASLARASGDSRIASRSAAWLLVGSVWGPLPVSRGLDLCDRVLDESGDNPYLEGFANVVRGSLHAMAGRWEESKSQAEAGWARLDDLGQHVTSSSSRMTVAQAYLAAGRPYEAEQLLQGAYDVLEPIGEKGYLSTIAAMLALARCAQKRYDEAERYASTAEELGASDDRTTGTLRRAALAEVLLSRGELEEAERLTIEALGLLEGTDFVSDRVLVLMTRAAVFKASGEREKMQAVIDEAVGLCKQKELVSPLPRLERLAADA